MIEIHSARSYLGNTMLQQSRGIVYVIGGNRIKCQQSNSEGTRQSIQTHRI